MLRFAFLRPGSNRALDLVNFFVADVQTGFGPFVAVYLTTHKWTQVEIGFALTLGTVTSLLSQLPAGILVDSMRNKRMAASGALIGVIIAALLLAVQPEQLPVLVAQILHGFASCVITPASPRSACIWPVTPAWASGSGATRALPRSATGWPPR